jgi:hypothetical protein
MSFDSIEEIEEELSRLQQAYIDEEDDDRLRDIERQFDFLLDEATSMDGVLRIAVGVSITNWIRLDS